MVACTAEVVPVEINSLLVTQAIPLGAPRSTHREPPARGEDKDPQVVKHEK